jgi:hypothetical protein
MNGLPSFVCWLTASFQKRAAAPAKKNIETKYLPLDYAK